MDSLPVTHAMNARNSALHAGSPRSATVLSRHASHLHRWGRAFVNPFLRIARPHKGHFLALEDLFLLIDQANPKSQAPRRINARLANHTPTHKTPVSLTADLRHTFLYLTRLTSCHIRNPLACRAPLVRYPASLLGFHGSLYLPLRRFDTCSILSSRSSRSARSFSRTSRSVSLLTSSCRKS